jgi:hypothetical protein
MNIYLYLRRTEDWKNVSIDNCHYLSDRGVGDQAHVEILREWNKKFPITWQKYRYNLQEKAFENWQLPILFKSNDVLSKDDNDVVIPIDDDDWIRPDIESVIRSEMKNNDLLQWTQIVNEYTTGRYISKWGESDYQHKIVYSTSDHCLRIGCVKKLSKVDSGYCLNGHGHVKKYFSYKRRTYIPETLSCYNHHIGSHSFLVDAKNDIGKIKKSARTIHEIPEWASWAEPLIRWLDQETLNVVDDRYKFKCF